MTPKINLAVQLIMGVALLVGMLLARRKQFRAHAFCQTTIVLLNLIPILTFMGPTFHYVVLPSIPAKLGERFYLFPAAHAALGTVAELLGLYILLSAGTKLLPAALRFRKYKPWMRADLALWWLVILLGIGTYWTWNVAEKPASAATPIVSGTATTEEQPHEIVIVIRNYAFEPKQYEVPVGTTVVWNNTAGRHTVTADDNSFDSPILAPTELFKQKFDKPGRYPYFCKLHGGAGGEKMSGTVIVK
jgi:plastocyanin